MLQVKEKIEKWCNGDKQESEFRYKLYVKSFGKSTKYIDSYIENFGTIKQEISLEFLRNYLLFNRKREDRNILMFQLQVSKVTCLVLNNMCNVG